MIKQISGLKGKEIVVEHREHFTRLLIVVVVVVAGFFLIRSLLVPKSFGKYGHYRGDNVQEQMDLPLVHLSSGFCKDCHEVQYGDWEDNGHSLVNCETCHGHWEIHNGRVKTMTAIKSSDGCLICHQKLTGRPEDFPQILSFSKHMEDQEVSEEDVQNCLDCHDPHVPL
jgi:hypothetical protein